MKKLLKTSVLVITAFIMGLISSCSSSIPEEDEQKIETESLPTTTDSGRYIYSHHGQIGSTSYSGNGSGNNHNRNNSKHP